MLTERHRHYVGWVTGVAARNGVKVAPVYDEDGCVTNRLEVVLRNKGRHPSLVTVQLVVPRPPAGWPPDPNQLRLDL